MNWKSVEDHIVKWLVGLFLGGIAAFVVFYFNVQFALGQQKDVNQRVEGKVNKIEAKVDTMAAVPIIQAEKVRNLEEAVKDIKKQQEKTDDKIDKIMTILLEIKGKQ